MPRHDDRGAAKHAAAWLWCVHCGSWGMGALSLLFPPSHHNIHACCFNHPTTIHNTCTPHPSTHTHTPTCAQQYRCAQSSPSLNLPSPWQPTVSALPTLRSFNQLHAHSAHSTSRLDAQSWSLRLAWWCMMRYTTCAMLSEELCGRRPSSWHQLAHAWPFCPLLCPTHPSLPPGLPLRTAHLCTSFTQTTALHHYSTTFFQQVRERTPAGGAVWCCQQAPRFL